ncbi:MAG: trehalose-phosphatase [Micrococcales bacterium]|nr:trehalose-phosphatase [Micrococcales bacterium]
MKVLVALDFDGTLAPFCLDPADSAMVPQARHALADLARAGVDLALVSGRGLSDLAERAQAPDGVILVGSHGAEWGRLRDGGLELLPSDTTGEGEEEVLAAIVRHFEALARDGAWVERKPTGVVLHTRTMTDRAAGRTLRDAAGVVARARGARVLDGDEALEAVLGQATKGQAVARLREMTGADIVLYAGDDVTDESALSAADLGIKVGDGASVAAIRVAGAREMGQLLEVFAALARAASAA